MASTHPELLATFEQALRGEQAARGALRAASERVAQLVQVLQENGIPSAKLAVRVAKIYGLAPTIAARRRIASSLRQRASRATRRHGNLSSEHGRPDTGAVASEQEEISTGKLLKRTVVEEFVESTEDPDVEGPYEEDEDEADTADEENEDGDSDEVGRPRPRSGRRPK